MIDTSLSSIRKRARTQPLLPKVPLKPVLTSSNSIDLIRGRISFFTNIDKYKPNNIILNNLLNLLIKPLRNHRIFSKYY